MLVARGEHVVFSAAAGFAHPNVVTVYDFGVEADSRAFLIMELLEGRTLREELKRLARLPAQRALAIMKDTAIKATSKPIEYLKSLFICPSASLIS